MIRSLELRNFKCFSDQRLDFGSLTLLCGLNGTGKSSVLQALLLLRQSFQQNLLARGMLALNGELAQIGTAQDALFEGAEEERIRFTLDWASEPSATWEFAYDRGADVLEAASAPQVEKLFTRSLFTDEFQYLCAERIGPRASFPTSDFSVRQHRQLGAHGEYTAHFLAVYGAQPLAIEAMMAAGGASRSLKDQAEAWLQAVSPGTRIHVTPHAGMDLVQIQYSFVSGEGVSSSYRPTNVGFGISYTLPILVAVLAASPSALVLLENPEAHLHPRGQVALGEFLAQAANAGLQLLVETHSDHILNGVRLAVHGGKLAPEAARIHFFTRRHEVISPRIDRQGRIDSWPEDFFDLWDKSLEALLMPAKE